MALTKRQKARFSDQAYYIEHLKTKIVQLETSRNAWRHVARLWRSHADSNLSGLQWKHSREEILQATAEAEIDDVELRKLKTDAD
jgi:hypothetical protein